MDTPDVMAVKGDVSSPPDIRRLATPRPRRTRQVTGTVARRIYGAEGVVADIPYVEGDPSRRAANAALIILAVNRDHHFDALTEALERLLNATVETSLTAPELHEIRAALDAARGVADA